MQAVAVKSRQKIPAKAVRHLRPHKMVHPDPGQSPERYLERAGPIDAALKRILLDPSVDLPEDLSAIPLVSREEMCLCEKHQVLMAVQLPDEFVVSDRGEIEIGNAAEIGNPGLLLVPVVSPPVDCGPRFDFESQEGK